MPVRQPRCAAGRDRINYRMHRQYDGRGMTRERRDSRPGVDLGWEV
jgi:hypothetical protein